MMRSVRARVVSRMLPPILLCGVFCAAVRVPADALLAASTLAVLAVAIRLEGGARIAARVHVLVATVIVTALEAAYWGRTVQGVAAVVAAIAGTWWAIGRVPAAGPRAGLAAAVGCVTGVLMVLWLMPWTPSLAVGSALSQVQRRAYFSRRVDWGLQRELAWSALRWLDSESFRAAMRHSLVALRDGHSQYLTASDHAALLANRQNGFGVLLVANPQGPARFDVAYLLPSPGAAATGLHPGDVVDLVSRSASELGVERVRPGRLRANLRAGAYALYRAPVAAQLPASVGYLELPGVVVADASDRRYAGDARRAIARNVTGSRCGWIVDARLNWGGSVYPMLEAAGTALPRGRFAIAYDGPSGRIESVYLDGGTVVVRSSDALTARRGPRAASEHVAILTSPLTASGGESLVLALRGDARDARTFGAPTAGAASATASIAVGRFGTAVVAAAVDVDSAGRTWFGAIAPDVPTAIDWSRRGGSLEDVTVLAAWRWLRGRCKEPA